MLGRIFVSALVLFGILGSPGPIRAAEIAVPSEENATIQEAIDAAQEGDTVLVLRGTYDEDFTLKSGVVVQGEEAAQTFLSGAIGGIGGTIQRFTMNTGLSFSNAQDLAIRNIVFPNNEGTALRIENSTNFAVSNNTFFANETGVEIVNSQGFQSSGEIVGNLFSGNTTALTAPQVDVTKTHNLYHDNGTNGDEGDDAILGADPLLVDSDAGDFHLKEASPCIDAIPADVASDPDGSDADCGAYGGPDTDPIPFRVSGLEADEGDVDDSAALAWQPNEAYNNVGYRVYYGLGPESLDGTGADQGDSPFDVGTETTAEVNGLSAAADPPPAPQGVAVFPGDERLEVTWDAAAEADGYSVLWGIASGAYDDRVDVGDATRYTIEGLSNGTTYFIAVQSYAAITYFFAVTALAEAQPDADPAESDLSEEVSVTLQQIEGGTSNEVSDKPKKGSIFPDLPDRGLCFIDTMGAAPRGISPGHVARVSALLAGSLLLLALSMRRRRWVLVVLALLCVPGTARTQEPRWAFSAKVGAWLPEEDNWDDNFDDEVEFDWKAGLGFRISRWLEVGLEAGLRKAEGDAEVVAGGEKKDQTLWIVPVQPYVLLDLHWLEDQLFVPYIGGGLNRYYYVQEIDGAKKNDGYLNGYHGMAGLKLLLNRFDPDSARSVRGWFGLKRTYFLVEAQYAEVDDFGDKSTDLGGWSFFGGAVLQF